MENNIEWSPELMVEVKLSNPDNFLKVRETLTRIGVCSRNENKLFQSCHILHKQGTYFIVHFLELFALDGKRKTISKSDFQRRNRIIKLLSDWGLVEVVNPTEIEDMCPMSHVKVISFKDKEQYQLVSKYTIGNYKK
jgi:hypothetical protein